MRALILDMEGVITDHTDFENRASKHLASLLNADWDEAFMLLWKKHYASLVTGKETVQQHITSLTEVVNEKPKGTEEQDFVKINRRVFEHNLAFNGTHQEIGALTRGHIL